jgi:hypothetical protein
MKHRKMLSDLYIDDENEQMTYGQYLTQVSVSGVYSEMKRIVSLICSFELMRCLRYRHDLENTNTYEIMFDEVMTRIKTNAC